MERPINLEPFATEEEKKQLEVRKAIAHKQQRRKLGKYILWMTIIILASFLYIRTQYETWYQVGFRFDERIRKLLLYTFIFGAVPSFFYRLFVDKKKNG